MGFLEEDLKVFENICGSRILRGAVVVVCFNKGDVVRKMERERGELKLLGAGRDQRKAFGEDFENFEGDVDGEKVEDILKYLEKRFVDLVRKGRGEGNEDSVNEAVVCFAELGDGDGDGKGAGRKVFEALERGVELKMRVTGRDTKGEVGVKEGVEGEDEEGEDKRKECDSDEVKKKRSIGSRVSWLRGRVISRFCVGVKKGR